MKKHGRFVAGVFGASVLLALGIGAFLTANDSGVKEANAAGNYSWNFSAGDQNKFKPGSLDLNGMSWTWAGDNQYRGNNNGSAQLGSSKQKFQGATMTGTLPNDFGNAISSISVKVSSASATGTIQVKIGDTVVIEERNTEKWSTLGTETWTSETPLTGDVEITFGAANGAYYLNGISITGADVATVEYGHLSITGTPTRTQYYVGDSFSTDGLTVMAYETAEETGEGLDVTDEVEWLIDPETFGSTDPTSVDVMASWNGLVALETINGIAVSEPAAVQSLEVINAKDTYKASEEFDSSAVKVYANMSDGNRIDVSSSAVFSEYAPAFEDFVNGTYDVTVSYGGVSETIHLNLTATIKDYRESGSNGIFVGTVTGFEKLYSNSADINVWVNDGTAGIMIYKISESDIVGDLAVGKKIAVEGGQTEFNGLAEVNSLTRAVILGNGEQIDPVEISAFDSTSLEGLDSSLINVEGLTYVSGSIANGTSAANVTVKYQGSNLTLRAPTAGAAVALRDAGLDAWLDKIEDLPFNFVGHLGWFNAPQLAPLSLDDFDCPDFNAVEAFVDGYMHMDEYQGVVDADGACLTTYPLAKEAFEKLSEVQQNYFLTSTYFVDAAARYNAWAVANGEALDSSLGVLNSISDSTTWIALGALLGVGAIAGAAIIVANRRRKAE